MTPVDGDVRAMILAAGLGTRLRPLTDTLPKPLVRVLDVPLIDVALEHVATAGIRRVAVNLHHRAQVLADAVTSSAQALGLELVLYDEPAILGTGGGLRNAYDSLRGADAVVLLNADTLVDVDLGAVVRAHLSSGAAATLLLRENPDPAAYAPVLTDDALRVRRIAGLPMDVDPMGLRSWMFAGVHVLRPRSIELLPAGVSDVNRALHPQLIAADEPVLGHVIRGSWWDIGTPERLLAANVEALLSAAAALLSAPAALLSAPAALLAVARRNAVERRGDSMFGPAVELGDDVTLRASVVGRGASIGPGATVAESVLFPGARIGPGAMVRGSIIGPAVDVEAKSVVVGQLRVGTTSVPIDVPHR